MSLLVTWYNVSNKLPAEGCLVYVWAKGWDKPEIVDFYDNGNGRGFCTDCGSVFGVTHWALVPMPEPPITPTLEAD